MKYTITILEHIERPIQGNVIVVSARKILSVNTDKNIVAEVEALLEEPSLTQLRAEVSHA